MNTDREAMEVIKALTDIRSRNEDAISDLRKENRELRKALLKAQSEARIARHQAKYMRSLGGANRTSSGEGDGHGEG